MVFLSRFLEFATSKTGVETLMFNSTDPTKFSVQTTALINEAYVVIYPIHFRRRYLRSNYIQ